jgi:hypothetical protein
MNRPALVPTLAVFGCCSSSGAGGGQDLMKRGPLDGANACAHGA